MTSTLYMYNDLKNWFFIQVHYRHFKLPKSYYFIKIQLAKVKVVIFSLSHFVYIPFTDRKTGLICRVDQSFFGKTHTSNML